MPRNATLEEIPIRTRMTIFTACFLFAAVSLAADAKPTLQIVDDTPPKELSDPIRTLLEPKGLAFRDATGKFVCTLWPRKALESKATADDIAKGVKYEHLDDSAVLGAVQFPTVWLDYRKQKVKPGVYTLRFAVQPLDGDHDGTAPHREFALLVPAAKDPKPDAIKDTDLVDLSADANGGKHASMMLLFPNPKPAATPTVEPRPPDHWVISYAVPVSVAGQRTSLGFSVNVLGVTKSQ
jgi:hypothetical protein